MKKLPIGIQTFRKIRENNYAYVDKTQMAVDLINRYTYVFLSRPRRFGKSLFLDTLRNLFEGNRELFEGLAAYKEYDWEQKYPVINISFTGGNFRTPADINERISFLLENNEEQLGIPCRELSPVNRFDRLIREAHKLYQEQVVVLIDEYDKPILDNIDQLEIASEAREELKAFYSVIKRNDEYIRFAFLTGVTKFSKVSVFSGINNIEDISLAPAFATICGYTQHDLETVFAKHLEGADMEQVKRWYDGYYFMGDHVYNPFDILLFLRNNMEFKNYWFETGTPSFLIKVLQQQRFFLPDLDKVVAGEELLMSFDVDNISPITLLFQAGYLTIKEVCSGEEGTEYTLGFPNLEVSRAFTNSLLDIFARPEDKFRVRKELARSLRTRDMDAFKKAIHTVFAAIPYHNYTNNEIARYEGFYASVMFTWLCASLVALRVEDCTNKGRIDMSVEMDETIYLIEFKVDMPGDKALGQIKAKGYPEKYQTTGKEVILIGIGFSSKERNVTEFVWEGGC